MVIKLNSWVIIITVCLFGCNASRLSTNGVDELPATSLNPYGRFVVDSQQNLELISSAAHVGFSFEGTECRLFVSLPAENIHSYFQYELDGVYQQRIKIEGNVSHSVVLTAPGAGKHTIWIYKTTEAHTGPILIQKVSGKNIRPLKVSDAPLIEFIGNSITCGAAADPSEVACGTGEYHDQHNAYFAYGPRVARTLGVNYILSSVSGIGIYRNWNSDGPTMPQVFDKPDFQYANSAKWNFHLFTPKIVSIALGTNDFSNGDGKRARLPFDSAAFVGNYVQFVEVVKATYPEAQIALLSSAMVNGNNRQLLQNCLTAVKITIDAMYVSGKRVAVYFFQPMQAHGCGGHPDVADHAILANELAPFFKQLLQ
ncbi:MAG: GDSL-type esterase/lipase family protein [Ferruginibacter sp.]